MPRPACFSSFGAANTGPMPISLGSQPATANPRNTPSGFTPRCAAARSLMTTTADAPSANWLALPAATTPPSRAGLIFDTPSNVVSGRIPSSRLTVTSSTDAAPESLSTTFIRVVIAAISSSKRPASRAAEARRWLATP